MTSTMLDRWTVQRASEPGSSTCGTRTLLISSDRFDSSVCWIKWTLILYQVTISELLLWYCEEWPCLRWCWDQSTPGSSASSSGREARLWRSGALRHPHLALARPAWGAASGSRADQEPLADVDIHIYSDDAEYRRIIGICQIDFYPATGATNLTRGAAQDDTQTHTLTNTHKHSHHTYKHSNHTHKLSHTLTHTQHTTLRLCSKWKRRVRVAEKTRRTVETLWWPCCSAFRWWWGSILLLLSNNRNKMKMRLRLPSWTDNMKEW